MKIFRTALRASLLLSVILLSAFAAACSEKSSVVKNGVFQNIDAQKAQQMIDENRANANFLLIDIRTPEEFASGHIGGAVNVDFFSAGFQAEMDKMDKRKTYLIYCLAGSRSGRALSMMQDKGFYTVYNLFGGIKEWNAANYPVVK
jgi:rhodanese-related sulfurtransferase